MKYTNPVISGFNPDPSICKVGGDYYLATSTFEYFPGLAIYHSTDLVNWEHISNAITRQSQLHYEKATASGGMWAPTIRHNNGRFYITATFMDYGNFIITTDDIYGEWSDPVQIEMDGIDPTILFDGDKMYYCANDFGSRMKNYGTEGVSVAEMKPDTFERRYKARLGGCRRRLARRTAYLPHRRVVLYPRRGGRYGRKAYGGCSMTLLQNKI